MERDDETRQLLREIRDAQREQLAEYRRVTGGVLVAALLVLLVYLLAKWWRYLFATGTVGVG